MIYRYRKQYIDIFDILNHHYGTMMAVTSLLDNVHTSLLCSYTFLFKS